MVFDVLPSLVLSSSRNVWSRFSVFCARLDSEGKAALPPSASTSAESLGLVASTSGPFPPLSLFGGGVGILSSPNAMMHLSKHDED